MKEERVTRESLQELIDLVDHIRIAMLVTVNGQQRLVSRPMTVREFSIDGHLAIFTSRDSAKVFELEREPEVNLAFADLNEQNYLSIAGRARIVDDRPRVRRLWSDVIDSVFYDGPDDPELVLIRIDVETAEWWKTPSSKLVRAWRGLKAKAQSSPEALGENRRVAF